MICPKCGNYVNDSERFCPNCDTEVRDARVPEYDEKAMNAAGASCRKTSLCSLIMAVACAELFEIGILLPYLYFPMAVCTLVFSLCAHKKLRAYLRSGYPMCGPAQAGKIMALISLPIALVETVAAVLFFFIWIL